MTNTPSLRELLRRYDLFIFDVDETLRGCAVPDQVTPHSHAEWTPLPGVGEVLRNLYYNGIEIAIATNQEGVELGLVDEATVQSLLKEMLDVYFRGTAPDDIFVRYCKDVDSPCHKPQPQMLLDAMEHFEVRPDRTVFVGDSYTDYLAAFNAKCHFMYPQHIFGWEKPWAEAKKEMYADHDL